MVSETADLMALKSESRLAAMKESEKAAMTVYWKVAKRALQKDGPLVVLKVFPMAE